MEGRASLPGEVLEVAREVAAIVRRAVRDPRYRVLLFGSWIDGRAGERSDIDIGVLGPAEVDPASMSEIREACEALPTLRTIDVVDLATAGSELRRAAVSEGLEVTPR